jgi:hypothetical protein
VALLIFWSPLDGCRAADRDCRRRMILLLLMVSGVTLIWGSAVHWL